MMSRTGQTNKHPEQSNSVPISPTIAVVGSLTHQIIFETERVPKLGESVACSSLKNLPGGKGANIAVAAYRCSNVKPSSLQTVEASRTGHGDIHVFMNGAVGDDELGPTLRKALEDDGVNVDGVRVIPGAQTGQAAVMVQPQSGESCALGFRGANALYEPQDHTVDCLTGDMKQKPGVLIAQCTLRLEMVEALLKTAHESEVETILSASPVVPISRDTYQYVDHLLFNEHEAKEMSIREDADLTDLGVAQDVAMQFVSYGARNVVITLGENGSVFATHKGDTGHVPAEPDVQVRDTTGAGYVPTLE